MVASSLAMIMFINLTEHTLQLIKVVRQIEVSRIYDLRLLPQLFTTFCDCEAVHNITVPKSDLL